jgi:hypothetical protein
MAQQPWTENEKRLVETIPDSQLAARIGGAATAVRVMRCQGGTLRREPCWSGRGRLRTPNPDKQR